MLGTIANTVEQYSNNFHWCADISKYCEWIRNWDEISEYVYFWPTFKTK